MPPFMDWLRRAWGVAAPESICTRSRVISTDALRVTSARASTASSTFQALNRSSGSLGRNPGLTDNKSPTCSS
jgi:hypothetical protein